ncbi:hypothetical protein L931_06790 [Helicobacter pylori PZ5024]|uniref:Uncharacterized protein n=1 Tax=Helicobacter pylori PZ5024 TaxID=1337391 RepID=T2SYJ3_HELPX|nr:hypothetical protein L931_06790 [Helicobacter pylori PZ5024]
MNPLFLNSLLGENPLFKGFLSFEPFFLNSFVLNFLFLNSLFLNSLVKVFLFLNFLS